jgi:hypothetical protein
VLVASRKDVELLQVRSLAVDMLEFFVSGDLVKIPAAPRTR